MAERIAGVARVLAIASGKGGVGKTTVTVNLALALAQTGARTGIFDADIYGPNIPLMLGVRRQEEARGWLPVARAAKEPYIPPLDRFGLQVMSIGLLVGEAQAVMPHPLFTGRIVTQTIRDVLWDRLDYLLIDLPPGTGEPQQSLLQAVPVDGAVVVTTPQDLSLLDAGRSLALFRQSHVPILGLVENMSYLYCPHSGERGEVFHHSDRPWAVHDTEIEVLGRIPMDLAISRGIAAGHPLLAANPDAAEAAVFRRIAARVREKLV
jgi:ATP-binding protein involved in chromosome partitioning